MRKPQFNLDLHDDLIVDIFAGAGGVSDGMEAAFGRPPDVAINHDEDAVSVHAVNHPQTKHLRADVREVCPLQATNGRRVGHLHLSPDCTDHSQARGGQPRRKATRALSWVGVRWVGVLRKRGLGPDVVTLENVEQILAWGPLIAKRDPATGRVLKLDRTVAAPGERVPVQEQYLIPDPKRRGQTWNRFVQALRDLGGEVQWKKLNSADYGDRTATRRERLIMICRFDGAPIEWPEPVRFKRPKPWLAPAGGRKPWIGAHTAIDFSRKCPSIFNRGRWAWSKSKKDWEWIARPLAEATMRRIALGVRKFVLECPEPFIVRIGQTGHDGGKVQSIREPIGAVVSKNEHCLAAPILAPLTHTDKSNRARDLRDPAPAFTGANRGELALISPTLVQFRHDKDGRDLRDSLPTITAGGSKGGRPAGAAHAMGIAAAYLAQMNGGFNDERGSPGHDLRNPATTFNTKGAAQQLVTAHVAVLQRHSDGLDVREPILTVHAGGQHHGVVECTLSPEDVEERGLRVAAFLMRYHGDGGQWADLREPCTAITTKARLALVTVVIEGKSYIIVDIGLRMLEPDELKIATGFQRGYILNRGHDGRIFPKSKQVKFVGNAVPPEMIEAVIRAIYRRRQPERLAA
jgi:DNA (cytosine-5)-methyltransferase 1